MNGVYGCTTKTTCHMLVLVDDMLKPVGHGIICHVLVVGHGLFGALRLCIRISGVLVVIALLSCFL